jgi:hypothetical protein
MDSISREFCVVIWLDADRWVSEKFQLFRNIQRDSFAVRIARTSNVMLIVPISSADESLSPTIHANNCPIRSDPNQILKKPQIRLSFLPNVHLPVPWLVKVHRTGCSITPGEGRRMRR